MSDGANDPNVTRLVRRLAAILNQTGLSEIEVEKGELRVRVARQLMVAAAAAAAAPVPAAEAVQASEPGAATTEALPAGEVVKSPMVGTAYLQAQPESPPFVRVGDRIEAGQTVLIVEAMKTMNPIPAPRSGVVRAILVADGQPVEYGQAIAVIE